jgi:serine/threonine protein kinase
MDNRQKSQQELEKIKREIAILKQLNNQHIVKLLDLSQTDNNLYLFLEYCNGGSLEEYLKKNEGHLSEDEA